MNFIKYLLLFFLMSNCIKNYDYTIGHDLDDRIKIISSFGRYECTATKTNGYFKFFCNGIGFSYGELCLLQTHSNITVNTIAESGTNFIVYWTER